MSEQISARPGPRFTEPPGGFFIWILLTVEFITVAALLIAYAISSSGQREVFREGAAALNQTYGLINTIVLLTSGWLMAEAVRHLEAGKRALSGRLTLLALLAGTVFLAIKGIEYGEKIAAGQEIGTTSFFTWYWLLTVFHVMHVLVGLVILLVMRLQIRKISEESFEAGAVFWHMCDVIWVLLFPALYLIF